MTQHLRMILQSVSHTRASAIMTLYNILTFKFYPKFQQRFNGRQPCQ